MSLCVSCCWLRSNVGSGRRSDARGPTLPVLVAQLALVELARGEAGKLVEELEALRHLVAGDVLPGERPQLRLELGAPFDAFGRLHRRHHLLAHLVVGDAEDEIGRASCRTECVSNV